MSVRADECYFSWTADLNGDGVPETVRYATTTRLPDIDQPDGGRRARLATVATLDGGVTVMRVLRPSYVDQRSPGVMVLSWAVADDALLRAADEAYATKHAVSLRLDHRWRQLRVTSSGITNRTVTVEAGYLLADRGDVSWLRDDASYVCNALHTVLYVTPANGLLVVGSGTSLPTGATELCAISVVGNIVQVPTVTGVENARTGIVTECQQSQSGSNYTGLSVTLQEVW